MLITKYLLATGELLCRLSIPEEDLQDNIGENEGHVEGHYDEEKYYFNLELQEINELPVKPHQFSVFNWSACQWDMLTDKIADSVRGARNMLLQESDWTDTLSAQSRLSTESQGAWQTYRQALRDITLQEGFPLTVTWPEKPE